MATVNEGIFDYISGNSVPLADADITIQTNADAGASLVPVILSQGGESIWMDKSTALIVARTILQEAHENFEWLEDKDGTLE